MKTFLTLNRLPSKLPPAEPVSGFPAPTPIPGKGPELLTPLSPPGSVGPGACARPTGGSGFPHRQALAQSLDPQGPACRKLTLACSQPLGPTAQPPPSFSPGAWLRCPGLCSASSPARPASGAAVIDGSLPEAGKNLCWENHFFSLQICLFQYFCKAGASPPREPGIGRYPRTQDSVSCLDRG